MISLRARAAIRPAAVSTLLFCSFPACAQTLGRAPEDGFSYVRVIAALALCLALAAGAAFLLRKRIGTGPVRFALKPADRRMQLIESVRLNQQVSMCLVRCDGQDYMLAVTPTSVSRIDAMPAPASFPTGGSEAAA